MPRLLILGGVCLIGLLALLFLTSVLPESEDGALESRGTDLLASRDEDGAWPGGDGRGRGPGLESGASNATGARGRSAESGTAGARGSSGPYHIIVFSSETELPVGAVEIRTRTGVLVGVTDLDGVLKVDKLPFPHFRYIATGQGLDALGGQVVIANPHVLVGLSPGEHVQLRGQLQTQGAGGPAVYSVSVVQRQQL